VREDTAERATTATAKAAKEGKSARVSSPTPQNRREERTETERAQQERKAFLLLLLAPRPQHSPSVPLALAATPLVPRRLACSSARSCSLALSRSPARSLSPPSRCPRSLLCLVGPVPSPPGFLTRPLPASSSALSLAHPKHKQHGAPSHQQGTPRH